VLIGLREFGDDKADIISKYYDEEAKELKELGEIPEHIKINEGNFDFSDDDDKEEEKDEDELDIDNVRTFKLI
jgi:translation initiation factor 1A